MLQAVATSRGVGGGRSIFMGAGMVVCFSLRCDLGFLTSNSQQLHPPLTNSPRPLALAAATNAPRYAAPPSRGLCRRTVRTVTMVTVVMMAAAGAGMAGTSAPCKVHVGGNDRVEELDAAGSSTPSRGFVYSSSPSHLLLSSPLFRETY
jgi:hypothetical protein